MFIENLTQIPYIVGSTDKTCRNKIESLFNAKKNIFPVSWADIWHRESNIGDINAFIIFHNSVVEYTTANGSIGGF